MYNYHDIFFYYAFGALNGGGGSIQVIGITEGTTSVTFESNGKPLITYRIYGSSSGVGDLNAETGKYDITVTCNEDTYTISLDAPLMDGEYIDYKTQRLYPSGLDVSMPEISTIEGTNTLTVITTNPSSKVYVECYRAKDIPLPVASTIIGSVPFEFQCYEAGNLMDYSISGNAVQDGTPSPEAPVDVVGSGVRTGNLVDESKVTLNTYISLMGPTGNSNVSNLTDYIDIGALPFVLSGVRTNDIMHSNTRGLCYYDSNKNYISGINYVPDIMTMPVRFSNIPQNAKYVRFAFDKAFENGIMLNLGSTALPYEPYGYKLPLTVNGTEYPIYLGQVESTRRVKKLVLTGDEAFIKDGGGEYLYYVYTTHMYHTDCLCSHLVSIKGYPTRQEGCSTYNNASIIYLNFGADVMNAQQSGNTVAGLKEYLAAQYAAGTPVTVWYVLATPETAVVNEPLMKIGDYTDTISFAQAGVAIPTASGANVLDMASTVKPSEVYVKGKGIKPTGYGQLGDVNNVNILDKDGRPINVHGQ